jgi:hypothetical protein
MILYFDTFITDKPFHVASDHFAPTLNTLKKIRSNNCNYKEQIKPDIFKYTLSSYLDYEWDSVYINFECENKGDFLNLENWIIDNFPQANISTKRSDNCEKWIQNLNKIPEGNPWIFYSPNNDHPIISNNLIDFNFFEKEAEKLELLHSEYNVSILYSHFPEYWNSIFPKGNLYDLNSTKGIVNVINETENYYVVECSRTPLDSIFIHRKNSLIKFFESGDKSSRVVRLEDISDKLFYDEPSIILIPKIEICRHYDSYVHTYCPDKSKYINYNSVPVLFIPFGFFEENIKVNYGSKNYLVDHLNVNPKSKIYSFEDAEKGSDFCLFYSELPFFIRKRVIEVKNVNLIELTGLSKATKLVYNPWLDLPWYFNHKRRIELFFQKILNIIK